MMNLTKIMDKNVGNGMANNVNDSFKVDLKSIYLSYYSKLSFTLQNTAAYPFEIDNVTANDKEFTAQNKILRLDLNGDGENDFELKWNGSIGETLQSGEIVNISIGMYVLSGAPECASLDFLIEAELLGENPDGITNSITSGVAILSFSSEAGHIFQILNSASSMNGNSDDKFPWPFFVVGLVPAMVVELALLFTSNLSKDSEGDLLFHKNFLSRLFLSPFDKVLLELYRKLEKVIICLSV